MRRVLPAAFALGALASAHVAPAAEKQRADIEGRWVAVRAERNGQAANDIVGHELIFENGNFVIRSHDGFILFLGTYQATPGTKGTIDFSHARGQLWGKTWLGIFARNGDTLTICDNAADLAKGRPTDFHSRLGDVLVTFQRAKP